MQITDPFTATWAIALCLVLIGVLALPVVRTIIALLMHAYAAMTGRHAVHALAHRVMPRIGHLLGSIVIGITSTATPAFAQSHAQDIVSVDRDAAVAASTQQQSVAQTPAPTNVPSIDRAASEPVSVPVDSEHAGLVYVVRVGDSLWDIAESHLDAPTHQQTTEAWKALWRANRAVIGEHPELITPGQVLHLDGLA